MRASGTFAGVAVVLLLGVLQLGAASRSVYVPSGDVDQAIFAGSPQWQEVPLGQGASEGEAPASAAEYEVVNHESFADHQLRISNTKSTLCDTVKQHSGFLDISDGRHLFFWFFEARNDPKNAPLMLWLNGGPGCSSIASGLLFENGPCFVAEGGNSTVHNPHAWTEHLNVIYLDEPIGTGYSYSSDGSTVDTLADLAVDVYAFLTVFLKKYPEYASAPFHLAAESWGGHYGPTIASYIHQKNEELVYYPRKGMIHINLASLILANGLTEPYSQFESIPDYVCGGAPYPFLDPKSLVCASLRRNRPVCLGLINACYKTKTKAACRAATAHCWPTMMYSSLNAKVNPYDIRNPCEEGSDICYRGIDDAGLWMNKTFVKKALGVDVEREFSVCNYDLNGRFYLQGQAFHNSAELLPKLLHNGVRLLVYAGNTDSVCNYQGIELWMSRLQHDFHAEFSAAPSLPWRTAKSNYLAGEVRSAGGEANGAGNFTFLQIYDAGHMAPHDQPEATLDMIERWIHDRPW